MEEETYNRNFCGDGKDIKKKKYKIKIWLGCDIEEGEEAIYDSLEEAKKDKESMELMQPENIYKIEEIE